MMLGYPRRRHAKSEGARKKLRNSVPGTHVTKHARVASQKCESLETKRVSPHVLRHTCAMFVLQATQDIRKVSLWLGHSSIQTTEIYTRADPSEKLDAINSITPPKLRKGRFRPPDKLIALLKGQSLWGARKPTDAVQHIPRTRQLPITNRSP